MNQQVVNKTKMELDEDFNIIDPEAEERKARRVLELQRELEELEQRRSWLLEDVWDLDKQILETKSTLKGYGK